MSTDSTEYRVWSNKPNIHIHSKHSKYNVYNVNLYILQILDGHRYTALRLAAHIPRCSSTLKFLSPNAKEQSPNRMISHAVWMRDHRVAKLHICSFDVHCW